MCNSVLLCEPCFLALPFFILTFSFYFKNSEIFSFTEIQRWKYRVNECNKMKAKLKRGKNVGEKSKTTKRK